MAFPTIDSLPTNPTVRVFFSGLMILEPLANNNCQVFVHNSSIDHNLSIEVRRKQPGRADIIVMRILDHLSFTAADPSHDHGLLIRTIGITGGPKGVKSYTGVNASPEGVRLRETFNMTTIHDVAPGAVDVIGGRPSILFDDATFYTANVSILNAELRKKDGSKTITLTQVPTIIGANIYLDATKPAEMVNLSWRQHGRDINLNLKQSTDFTYEIYINNEPLFEEDSVTAPFSHDEFDEYYKILPGITHNEQFSLVFPTPTPDRGSTRTPCMSVLLHD
jgi:hypothetical protein